MKDIDELIKKMLDQLPQVEELKQRILQFKGTKQK